MSSSNYTGSFDSLLRRWKKSVEKDGKLRYAKDDRHFVLPSEKKRLDTNAQRRRYSRQNLKQSNQSHVRGGSEIYGDLEQQVNETSE